MARNLEKDSIIIKILISDAIFMHSENYAVVEVRKHILSTVNLHGGVLNGKERKKNKMCSLGS